MRTKYLQEKINVLELTVRTHNMLEDMNIRTIEDLTTQTEEGLIEYKHISRKAVNEIKLGLADMGLTLDMTHTPPNTQSTLKSQGLTIYKRKIDETKHERGSEFQRLTEEQREQFDKIARRGKGRDYTTMRNIARFAAPAPGSIMQQAFSKVFSPIYC